MAQIKKKKKRERTVIKYYILLNLIYKYINYFNIYIFFYLI